jgi:CubicO group peptidase (beta-lactamase class C family)
MYIACRLIACLACLVGCLAMSAAAQTGAPANPEVLREAVADFIAREQAEHDIPGIVVVIVEAGNTVLLEGYGTARLEDGLPMTPDTIVRAGSVSKLMTSLAVLRWLEAAGISADAPVADYLGSLDLPRVAASRASFRDYLTHAAGFDDSIEDLHTYDRSDWQDLAATLRSRDAGPVAAPGRAVAYSSWPLAILGAVLEKQTGQSFEAFMEASVFGPLAMDASSFAADREDYGAGLPQARGYRMADGQVMATYPFNHVRLPPGIALRTTGRDMARFLEAALAGDSALPEPVWTQFQAPQLAHYPGARGRALGPSERFDHGYRALWHDGNGLGFVNRAYWIPEADFGFFISLNHALMEPGPQVSDAALLVNRFTDFILDARLPEGDASTETAVYPRYLVDDAVCDDLPAGAVNGFYRPANYPRRTLGRIASLFDGLDLRLSGPALQAGATTYRSVDGSCRWQSDAGRVIAWQPGTQAEPPLVYLGAGAFSRAPWFETPRAQAFFAGLVLVGGLGVSAGWLLAGPVSRTRRGIWALSAALPVSGLAVTVGMLMQMDPQDLFLGRLGALTGVVPGLLLSAIAGAVALVWSGPAAERAVRGPIILRALAMAQIGVALLGLWLAVTWNLPATP